MSVKQYKFKYVTVKYINVNTDTINIPGSHYVVKFVFMLKKLVCSKEQYTYIKFMSL